MRNTDEDFRVVINDENCRLLTRISNQRVLMVNNASGWRRWFRNGKKMKEAPQKMFSLSLSHLLFLICISTFERQPLTFTSCFCLCMCFVFCAYKYNIVVFVFCSPFWLCFKLYCCCWCKLMCRFHGVFCMFFCLFSLFYQTCLTLHISCR